MIDKRLLKTIIKDSQRTQRNWNLDKTIPKEDIELLKLSVSECPSKQNLIWYNVTFVTNKNIIKKIYQQTDGFTYSFDPLKTTTNSQTLANMLVIFSDDKDVKKDIKISDTDDTLISIGISSAYLNYTAHLLGYKTGYCACFDKIKVGKIIDRTDLRLIVGIGYPDETKDRRQHHLDDFIYPSFDKKINIKEIV